MSTKSLIYLRVSTLGQTEGSSLEEQRDWALGHVNGNPYIIYEEPGRSAESIDKRPVFKQMLSEISAGTHDGATLYAFHQFRISRSVGDWAHDIVPLFLSHDIHVITEQGEIDLGKRDQVLLSNIKTSLAWWQLSDIRDKCVKGKRRLIAEGFFPGGKLPLGFKYNHEVTVQTKNGRDKPTLEVKNEWMTYIEQVYILSKNHLVNDITSRMPLIEDRLLSADSIRSMLIQPLYAGYRFVNGRLMKCPQVINPLIPMEWFIKRNGDKPHQKRYTIKQKSTRYVFNGLVFCGYCGKPCRGRYTSRANAPDYVSYVCSTKRYYFRCNRARSLKANLLYGFVIEDLVTFTDNPNHMAAAYAKAMNSSYDVSYDIDKIKLSIGDLEAQQNRLLEGISKGTLDMSPTFRAKWEERIRSIEIKLQRQRLQLKDMQTDKSFPDFNQVKDALSDLMKSDDIDMIKKMMALLIDKITLYSARLVIHYNYFGTSTIRIPFKRRFKKPVLSGAEIQPRTE
jgi:DNA invertase Pin-like site-specific DNA recombinase